MSSSVTLEALAAARKRLRRANEELEDAELAHEYAKVRRNQVALELSRLEKAHARERYDKWEIEYERQNSPETERTGPTS